MPRKYTKRPGVQPGRPCRTCVHDDRAVIDTLLAGGKSAGFVAQSYGIPVSSVHRHQARHLRPGLVRAAERREDLTADALVQKLLSYLQEAEGGIAIAKGAQDLQGLARCLKEARETAVYIGKTIGLWNSDKTTIIDARRQTVNLSGLSTEELRSLAMLTAGRDAITNT